MTNFLLAIPEIPLTSGIERPITQDPYQDVNVAAGARSQHYRSASPTTQSRWAWSATSQTQPNLFGICRADLMAAWEPTSWTVEGASVSNFASTQAASGVFSLTSLQGPRAEDFITSLNFSSPWQYWRVTLSTQSACYHEVSKLYLGSAFDFEREPTYEPMAQEIQKGAASWREPLIRLSLTWRGVSAAKKQSMISTIARYMDTNAILFYDPADYVLHGMRAFHAHILDYTTEQIAPNNYTITMRVEEMI